MSVVSPKIRALFELGADGKPQVIDSGDRHHYKLKLVVDDAPAQAETVTFTLHPTYYDPVREVFRSDRGFEEPITSYGDFEIVTTISGVSDPRHPTKTWLSDALKAYYQDHESNDAIREALVEIEKN